MPPEIRAKRIGSGRKGDSRSTKALDGADRRRRDRDDKKINYVPFGLSRREVSQARIKRDIPRADTAARNFPHRIAVTGGHTPGAIRKRDKYWMLKRIVYGDRECPESAVDQRARRSR